MRSMPGQVSNPRSKLKMRLISDFRINGNVKGVPRGDTIHRGDEISSGTNLGHVESQSVID